MASCILHVGMPKTGTTSIQESLYFGLDDPAFRYVGLGRINSAAFLEPLFTATPERFWRFRAKGYPAARIGRIRAGYADRLRRALRRARERSRTPILSAEQCWHLPASDLERLRDFLVAEGFETKVIAYLRPIKSYLESQFQQQVKWERGTLDPLPWPVHDGASGCGGWTDRLAVLERLFGRERLVVRPFVRAKLVDGCAVRDFCDTLGIRLDPAKVLRTNDALSADAVRFLYAHNRFVQAGPPPSYLGRILLFKRLEGLEGVPFRLHSSLLAPFAGRIDAEHRLLRDRYGIDLAEDLTAADRGPCVRDEADLFRFDRASLDWLARATGSAPIGPCEGEAAARLVAERVERLRRRPDGRTCRAWLAGDFRRRLRWLRHGD